MKKYAILIGNSKFPDEHDKEKLKDLHCPENDVDGLGKILASECGEFDVLSLKNEESYKILRELQRKVKQAEADDLLLVYYAGHGKPNRAGILHLTTFDTVITELETSAISINRVYEILDTAKCRKVVILLDCCFSGMAENGFRGAIDDKLQQLNNSRGTYLITASTKEQYAHESKAEEGYGLFTKHLIAGLETGEADKDGDGWVSMNELYDYVQSHVVAENSTQHPTEHVKDRRGMNLPIVKSGKSGKSGTTSNDTTITNLHPLIKSALEELTIVCNKSALHVLDEDRIKSTLKALYEHGEVLNSVAMYSWLLEHKWSQRPAKFVAKIATNLAVGEQVRFKQKYYIESKEDIIQRLKQRNSLILKTELTSANEGWQVIGKYKVKDGLAIDTETGLAWLRFAYRQTWTNSTTKWDAVEVNWTEALATADDFNNEGGYANYKDWRLPSIDELKTLVDKNKGKEGSYINADVFPNNPVWCWSLSPSPNGNKSAYSMNFKNGDSSFSGISSKNSVRLVRGKQLDKQD